MRTMIMMRFTKALLEFILIASLFGCVTLPPPRYYTLNNVHSNQSTRDHSSVAESIKIQIGAISIPEVVNRPQLVISHPDHRVEILFQERWSQPLRYEISTAITSGLQQYLPGAVITDARIKVIDADYRISLDVRKFETTHHSAAITVLWKMEELKNSKIISRESHAVENFDGKGYEQRVAAHSQALQRISEEIAKAIKSLN